MTTAEDLKWKSERDANTLAEAEAIKMDKPRCARAVTAAKRLADDKHREAAGMEKVSQSKVSGNRKVRMSRHPYKET